MGKKYPVSVCYCFQYFKGHSGRQTTPNDPCQRVFLKGFKVDLFRGRIRAQNRSILKVISMTRAESLRKIISIYFKAQMQFCFCFSKNSYLQTNPQFFIDFLLLHSSTQNTTLFKDIWHQICYDEAIHFKFTNLSPLSQNKVPRELGQSLSVEG
jgi:hypothetical protein